MLKVHKTILILSALIVTYSCNTNDTAVNSYSVSYNGNGNTSGEAPIDSNSYKEGDSVIVKEPTGLLHTGYLFSSWNTNANGKGTNYVAGSSLQIQDSNVTLYAKWTSTGSNTQNTDPDPRIAITITTKNGGDVTLTKAPLLYDKQHILTMETDDALNDPYKTFLPLFTGGIPEHDTVASPGLYITDGCTNDVSYKSNSTAWVIAPVNQTDWFAWSNGEHWLNYAQLDTLIANGFGLVSHGYYTDMTHPSVNVVTAVNNYVTWAETRYGFRPLYAVKPGGQTFDDQAWKNAWFEKGLRFISMGSGAAASMTRVDDINISTFTEALQIGRRLVEESSAATVMGYVNTMIASPGNQWLRLFGHNVNVDDFVRYADIKEFFTQLNTLYGKPGNDSIWVANINDVISYLYCRDTITTESVKEGNKTTFYINQDQIPSYLTKRLITFKINTTDQITDIRVSDNTNASMCNSLVNVIWQTEATQ